MSYTETIKQLARSEYQRNLQWVAENRRPGAETDAEVAANMAADEVMYRLGMREYAAFQNEVGGMDVKTWLLSTQA